MVNTNAYPQWTLGDTSQDDDSWHQGSWSSSSWQEPPIATGWHPSDWTQTSTDQAFNTYETQDSGTDTDIVSSNDETWYDLDDIPPGLDDKAKAEELSLAYQRAKGRYRQFIRKPVRRVRRFLKRKGKGKGKRSGYFLATLSEPEIEKLFFIRGRRKGKGKGKFSSGKRQGTQAEPQGT